MSPERRDEINARLKERNQAVRDFGRHVGSVQEQTGIVSRFDQDAPYFVKELLQAVGDLAERVSELEEQVDQSEQQGMDKDLAEDC